MTRSDKGRSSIPSRAGQFGEGGHLSREAERLLQALGRPGACVRTDPLEEGAVVVRSMRPSGISLGSGRFRGASLRELRRHDLVERLPGAEPEAARLSEAGRAHLQRAAHGGEDSFAGQHRELTETAITDESGTRRVTVNASESPLAWLRRRRDRDGQPLIDAAAYEAGERLRRDITQASFLPSVTSRWDLSTAGRGGGPRDASAMTDVAIAARQRISGAMTALGGDFADLLLDLCGFLKGLETLERERGWPPRSGKVVVRLALGRLADHYGLRPLAEGPAASRGVRTWHALLDESRDPVAV